MAHSKRYWMKTSNQYDDFFFFFFACVVRGMQNYSTRPMAALPDHYYVTAFGARWTWTNEWVSGRKREANKKKGCR